MPVTIKRVACIGSRSWTDEATVAARMAMHPKDTVFVVSGAHGAEALVVSQALKAGLETCTCDHTALVPEECDVCAHHTCAPKGHPMWGHPDSFLNCRACYAENCRALIAREEIRR